MTNRLWQTISSLYQANKNFIWYSIIGVSGATLDFVAFLILTRHLDLFYQTANIISVTLGITNNFFWNAYFNFKVKSQLGKRFVSFYLIGLLGLGVTAILLYIMIDLLSFMPLLSKFITIIFVVIIQYTLNKKLSFSNLWIRNK